MGRPPLSNALRFRRAVRPARGFTLIEILVASTVLLLLLGLMLGITNQVSKSWRFTTGKIEAFQEARRAFESITRQLSQAALNPYWDYIYQQPATTPPTPIGYQRQSELRFASGMVESPSLLGAQAVPRPTHGVFFNANLGFADDSAKQGLNELLNTWGYYVEFGSDAALRPPFLNVPAKFRFRLMEMMQPTEQLDLYKYTSGNPGFPMEPTTDPRNQGTTGNEWFSDAFFRTGGPPSRVLAENIIALVILPKLSPNDDPAGTTLSPTYLYRSDKPALTNTVGATNPLFNSKHQLPPVLQVTMVAIDQISAQRLQDQFGENFPSGLQLAGKFESAANYEIDLKNLEGRLQELGLKYRVFTSNVALPASKWSSEQAQ